MSITVRVQDSTAISEPTSDAIHKHVSSSWIIIIYVLVTMQGQSVAAPEERGKHLFRDGQRGLVVPPLAVDVLE